MLETRPLIAPAVNKHGVSSDGRALLIAAGVLVVSAGARIGLAAVIDLPRPVGTFYSLVLLVLVPTVFCSMALHRRATSTSRQQVAISFSVIAAMLTLVGYDRTSMWFMAISVSVGAGCLSLAWDVTRSSSVLAAGLRSCSSAAIALAIASAVIVIVPGAELQNGYLWSAGATTLVIGPIAVGCVLVSNRTLRRRARIASVGG